MISVPAGQPGWELPVGSGDDEVRLKLRLIVKLRGIAVVVFALLLVLGHHWDLVSNQQILRALLPVGMLLMINLYAVPALKLDHPFSEWHLFAQMGFDLLAITTLLWITGGGANPFYSLIFMHATLGALMLTQPRSGLFYLLVIGSLLAMALAFAAYPGVAVFSEWFLPKVIVASSIFFLVAWLARLLRVYRQRLENLRHAWLHLDRLHGIGALTAGLCHELHTPLNTINLKLDRLRTKLDQEGSMRDLVVAGEAVAQCQHILQKMMDTQADPDQFILETVEAVSLLQPILDSWCADKPGMDVRMDTPRNSMPVSVPVQPFARTFCDLLDNAGEAMNGVGRIDIRLRRGPDLTTIQIHDRGPGWPEVVVASLGQPFVTTRENGVGLGLYNAHLLVRALGGGIALDNRPDGGACVTLAFPNAEVKS
jgi:two-component system sensor histidine kinase RegB